MRREGKNYKYGVDMERWCRDHEAYMAEHMEKAADEGELRDLLAWHETKLAWLQHERLVHLIVMVMTVFGELFTDGMVVFTDGQILALIFMYGVLIVLIFYVRHYFVLENTVQRWYMIAEELRKKHCALVGHGDGSL